MKRTIIVRLPGSVANTVFFNIDKTQITTLVMMIYCKSRISLSIPKRAYIIFIYNYAKMPIFNL